MGASPILTDSLYKHYCSDVYKIQHYFPVREFDKLNVFFFLVYCFSVENKLLKQQFWFNGLSPQTISQKNIHHTSIQTQIFWSLLKAINFVIFSQFYIKDKHRCIQKFTEIDHHGSIFKKIGYFIINNLYYI